jgi:hypothetical protein
MQPTRILAMSWSLCSYSESFGIAEEQGGDVLELWRYLQTHAANLRHVAGSAGGQVWRLRKGVLLQLPARLRTGRCTVWTAPDCVVLMYVARLF